ncbi:MAG: hypothetical protein ACOYOA_12165 [Saprospiraceae bacterium]
MKKSAFVQLVLVATVAASCSQKEDDWEGSTKKKVYMRSDTTASYTQAHRSHGFFPFFIFRPFGSALGSNGFRRSGYYSNAIHPSSNVGRNSFKSSIVRGGFGRSGFHASS